MTKRRDPITFERALTTVAARIGWDSCAAICGVSERMVRYWSDPECEVEIRLIDALRLDKAFIQRGGDHAPFHQTYALRLELAASEPAAGLVDLAATAALESGQAIAALLDAAAKPSCPKAARRARQEGEEAIDALTRGLAAIPAPSDVQGAS